ncbi:MAG TPA: hypothetical protein VMD59_01055, partial [Acidimicrobiales bacterium]|nr:hypothetical protein [Acidimicrobiales bacterium]
MSDQTVASRRRPWTSTDRRHAERDGSGLRAGTRAPGGRRDVPAPGLVAGAVYVLLALLVFWPVQPFSTTKVVSCGCYDVAEQMWFLAWTPHAILHGLNPFYTNALNVPFGANLAANTTMPLLGILASPITLGLGPVASFNVLIRLALCASAMSMCLVLRHYRLRWPVAFLGGLVYGFSPYMLAQGSLHLNLCFVPLFPPLVVAIDELVVRDRHSARRAGLTLGALATAQYFISSELLADLGVLTVIGLVLLAVRYPARARARARRIATGVGWALVPFVVLVAYPFVFSLAGPEHVAGSGFNVDQIDIYRNDVLSPLVPTTGQLLAPGGWGRLGTSLVPNPGLANSQALPGPENDAYIGIPLVAFWLASLGWSLARRNGRALVLGVLAGVAFLLSLGPMLDLHGRTTSVSLPFGWLEKLPVYDFSAPSRLSLFSDLGLVVCVAFAFDALLGWLGERRWRDVRLRTAIAGGALAGVALVPLLPSQAIVTAAADVPGYFSSPAVQRIAPGAVVLAYPYPQLSWNEAQLW